MNPLQLSAILPAKNEASSLPNLISSLHNDYPQAEIIVVDDGSSDNTESICATANIKYITHPYSKGNGAAIKTGTRHASGDILIFMDADGQHQPRDIQRLLDKLDEGYDMVVGARNGAGQANIWRGLANKFYNRLASWMVGQEVKDLTSGFRAVHAEKFKEFIHLLPNGFSYPTTSTMAFFRAGYSVGYEPINVLKRNGKSHINLFRDGVRFLLIIFKIGTLYSPLKRLGGRQLLPLHLHNCWPFYQHECPADHNGCSNLLDWPDFRTDHPVALSKTGA
jgi:glycosyltransferase involved in cell wall biosynthesis